MKKDHCTEAFLNFLLGAQGVVQPIAQEPGTHGGVCIVECFKKRMRMGAVVEILKYL